MKKLFFRKIINLQSPILITGPSGTGKSQFARKIFDHSKINQDNFLTLHLASLKEDLIESELFGHKKGSFTGAIETKIGYLQDAGKGTLFLDEIGELSLESQKKLLYLLEEKKFTPLGETRAIEFKGRLIMATNKDLQIMVKEGKFREDLYYRICMFQLELPPIKKNRELLKSKILNIFESMKNKYNKLELKLSCELFDKLHNAEWRGNYRELKNCLEYIVAISDSNLLTVDDLPQWFFQDHSNIDLSQPQSLHETFPIDYTTALEKFEECYLKAMLERYQGKVNLTSREIGLSKSTLISKAKKYQISSLAIRARKEVDRNNKKAA